MLEGTGSGTASICREHEGTAGWKASSYRPEPCQDIMPDKNASAATNSTNKAQKETGRTQTLLTTPTGCGREGIEKHTVTPTRRKKRSCPPLSFLRVLFCGLEPLPREILRSVFSPYSQFYGVFLASVPVRRYTQSSELTGCSAGVSVKVLPYSTGDRGRFGLTTQNALTENLDA